jgi:hypothetical protein
MILIYLIDRCLPNLFSEHLHGLACDLTIFDQWLKQDQPQLHEHLECLRTKSICQQTGTIDEPALLNVFTIQWFLTVFSTCLSKQVTLRVWDVLMIEGNDVLFRTGLILWSKLAM